MAAAWPPAAATDATLSIANNSLETTLSGAIDNAVTSIPLTSTTGFPTAGFVTIDLEVISYTGVSGGNLTGAVRGADGTTAASHTINTKVSATAVAAHHNSLKDEIKAVEEDLVNAIGAITPATAAATATTLYNRLQHIASQIKNLGGLTNWYDAVTAALLKSGGTMSGAIAMGTSKITGLGNGSAAQDAAAFGQIPVITPGAIAGTATNDNAPAGGIGEYVESIFAGVAFPATTVYGDATSIALTAGDWDVFFNGLFSPGSALAATLWSIGISLTAGNSTTGLVIGGNYATGVQPVTTAGVNTWLALPAYRLSIATTKTVYAKFAATYSVGGPSLYGRLSARRVR